MTAPLTIGAFASVQYLAHIETYLATGDGDFDGPIWARTTSEPQSLPTGGSQFTISP